MESGQKEDEIYRLIKDNEILKQQNREIRKHCRQLERKLGAIEQSRAYRLSCYLSHLLHHPFQVIYIPVKAVRYLYRRWCRWMKQKKQVQTTVSDTKQLVPRHELRYPEINGYHTFTLDDIQGHFRTVTVIVCVHNALYDVEECLLSLWENRTFPYEIIIVDDGSDEDTKLYLEEYARLTCSRLIRNNTSLGYTRSANIGLKQSSSEYSILLNSDTIVTDGWVEKLLDCYESQPSAGIVSPLSNAASYQSVPAIHDAITGDWKINSLDEGITVELMGQIVEEASECLYPSVPVLNGFCFMLSKTLIESIGYLDEESFPKGYGEEVDYCLRAKAAGFTLHVADNAYVFHEKSKSFSHQTRKELGKASKDILLARYGQAYSGLDSLMIGNMTLHKIRDNIINVMQHYKVEQFPLLHLKIAFLLTARGGSGGANSVCQEVMGLRRLGIKAFILNSSNYKDEFEANYPELSTYIRYFDKNNIRSLIKITSDLDFVIGTIFTTMKLLVKIRTAYPHIKLGYYIQDYEPMFFERSEPYWQEAFDSYTLLDKICMFAKTKWIANTVKQNHGREVNLVEPSMDTRVYNPYIIQEKTISAPVVITAMIRPKTGRRNPLGTMEVLKLLKEKYGDKISIMIFGCNDEELKEMGPAIQFSYINAGILKRWEVADLMAHATIFLDLSTYQAFGRTGLESMSVACVPVVPAVGGTDKYAIDGTNAIVVDTEDLCQVFNRICEVLDDHEKLMELQRNGLNTAKKYQVMKAAMSEARMLNDYFRNCSEDTSE